MSETLDYPATCWPVDWSCVPDLAEEHSADAVAQAEALATSSLQMLTLYQVGGCPITVRPCARSCLGEDWSPVGDFWMSPHVNSGGRWVNACGCRSECGCGSLSEIVLPGPVGRVDWVTIDGDPLSPTAYRVDNGNRLVRLDGGVWPTCQDMSAPPGTPGAFTVTYLRGLPVDALGARVAGLLAKEFLSICEGGECALPSTVTAVTRQGVTFELPTGAFPNGQTGIAAVDAWLAQFNPYGVKRLSYVTSPDARKPRQTTRGF